MDVSTEANVFHKTGFEQGVNTACFIWIFTLSLVIFFTKKEMFT